MMLPATIGEGVLPVQLQERCGFFVYVTIDERKSATIFEPNRSGLVGVYSARNLIVDPCLPDSQHIQAPCQQLQVKR
jgi:hypothetical protein